MLWLFPVVLLSFGFGQLFKWSQRRRHSAPVVVASNYLVLAALLASYFSWSGHLLPSRPALLVGLVTGVAFIASMLVMTHALERIDAAATLTAFRLAIAVPIAAGVWLWDETIAPLQALGIGLSLISLFLLTWRGRQRHSPRAGWGLVALVFALQGLSQCCLRWVHYAGLDAERLHVLMVTALSAGLSGLLYIGWRRLPLRRADLGMGAGIGAFNLVALAVILTALARLQGTVFFPLSGCGVVLLDNLCAHFVWREPLGRSGVIGALAGAAAMLLIAY